MESSKAGEFALGFFWKSVYNKRGSTISTSRNFFTVLHPQEMDSFNLKTASTYINNLLLARALLRNGSRIEFARPSKGEGGTEATLAQIINLVHDLILRRDVSTSSTGTLTAY